MDIFPLQLLLQTILRYFVHHPFNICKPQSKLYTLLACKPIPAKLTGVNTVTQVTNDTPGCKISYGKKSGGHYLIKLSPHTGTSHNTKGEG